MAGARSGANHSRRTESLNYPGRRRALQSARDEITAGPDCLPDWLTNVVPSLLLRSVVQTCFFSEWDMEVVGGESAGNICYLVLPPTYQYLGWTKSNRGSGCTEQQQPVSG